MPTQRFDVLVCGAGPAGSTAAKHLAERGLSVALIDKATFPREKQCGGGLFAKVSTFSYVMSDTSRFFESESYGVKVFSPSLKWSLAVTSETPLFYNALRWRFDNALVEVASESGAVLFLGQKVDDVCVDGNGVEVCLRSGDRLQGQMLLLATGYDDTLLRHLLRNKGVSDQLFRKRWAVALYDYFEVGEDFILERYGRERFYLAHVLKFGRFGTYGWAFPKKTSINVGTGAILEDTRSRDVKALYTTYIRTLIKQGYLPADTNITMGKGGSLPFGGVRQSVLDRVLVLGDTAGFISPLSGEGITFAMESGVLAAEVAAEAISTRRVQAKDLSKYHLKWREEWGRDLRILTHLNRDLGRAPEEAVKYAVKDPVFRDYLIGVLTGRLSVYAIRRKMLARTIRDVLLYTVLRRS